jgi:hypothetical protein
MRWLAFILVASAAAFAQARGVPASVTSLTPTNNPAAPMVMRGVPSSVTSPGPQGFSPQPRVFPAPQPRHHGRHDRPVVPVYVPVYYSGYYYDPYTYYDQQPPQQVVERAVEKEAQPQKVEIVIVDKREEEKKAEAEAQALKEAAEPKQSNLSEPSDVPAVFVFKDGSRKELGNFAIMANTLYDLTENRVRKIALNTVDRDATLAENAKIGRDIQLP